MSDDNELTPQEQAALDEQRNAPAPEAPAQDAPETPADGAVVPEAAEGGEPQAGDDKRPQMVPHAALHQERTRRQEVERQAAEDRRKYEARFEELLKLVPQPQAQPQAQPAEPPLPDAQQDPAGYIVENMRRQGASLEQTNQALTELRQQQQQQQVVAAVQQRAAAMEANYRAQNPEYDSSIEFLRNLRGTQLRAMGLTDPQQIAQQIASEAFQAAVVALQQGANPAERLHRYAEASGWKPGTPAQDAAPAYGAQAMPAPDEAERLRTVQQGQAQTRGLGAVRGNGPSPMTAQKLLDMPDDEVLEFVQKSKEARRLLGA